MIHLYIRQVFVITSSLARCTCGFDTWVDISFYWTENMDPNGLKDFRFDDADDYMRSRKPDRSLAGIVYHPLLKLQPC